MFSPSRTGPGMPSIFLWRAREKDPQGKPAWVASHAPSFTSSTNILWASNVLMSKPSSIFLSKERHSTRSLALLASASISLARTSLGPLYMCRNRNTRCCLGSSNVEDFSNASLTLSGTIISATSGTTFSFSSTRGSLPTSPPTDASADLFSSASCESLS